MLPSISPTSISRQGDYIYIGSFNGVFAYSISKNKLENIAPDRLQGKQILSILRQSPICLWVGTEGSGLFKINLQTKEVTNYTNIPGKKNSISSNYIRSLTLDSQNTLWVGTINALNIYNEKMTLLRDIPAICNKAEVSRKHPYETSSWTHKAECGWVPTTAERIIIIL